MNIKEQFKITLKHQVIFWLIYFLFNTYRWGRYFNDFTYSFQTNLIGFPIHMTLCYLNIYILMPLFLYRRKYTLFILFLLASIFLMVLVKFNLTYYLVGKNVWPEGPEVISTLTTDYVIDMMIGELYVVTFVTAIKITMDWIKEHKRLTDLERAQLETELLFLRSQVSPHFFLNTLNNIYSLALSESKRTPKVILKLSELMRYLLYDTKEKRQTLQNELLCIQNYLELERIRYGENLKVNMNISGEIENKKIAPMLLLPFVENAFKHSAHKSIKTVEIDLDFKIENDYLNFRICNPISTYFATEKLNNKFSQGGLGLKNVRKRLELGYRKKDYTLSIDHNENHFIVDLKIKI